MRVGLPTVSVNEVLAETWALLTVMMIVAAPCWPEPGVTVTVRFVPLPPKTMFAGGTNEGSEEGPESAREAIGIGRFVIVNGNGLLEPFTGIVTSAMDDNFGANVPGGTKTFGPAAKLLATSDAEGEPLEIRGSLMEPLKSGSP